ncbi:hypothetical protein MJO28_005640 [Puccinia striiformis f. sp. tritici]|uniref:Uncharacterized protein n=1 Tax=Puccinia striiformis f. sp. tritici TaxID=168172 RepID=A0ACC0EL94_9BASI|nr:hypothetical protein MJO28_005640 [Puccinia striiformis f. sp. tritici]
MTKSLASCQDLLRLYPSEEQAPNNQIVLCLIYSSTQHATLKVLEVLDNARGTSGQHLAPDSPFARRSHACTDNFKRLNQSNFFDYMLN